MYIIYRNLKGLAMTDEANYNARIRNERKVSDFSAFDTPEEVIDYCVKYFGGTREEYKVEV